MVDEATQPVGAVGLQLDQDAVQRLVASTRGYGPNYKRLAQIKTTYDPSNLFRHNQNIRPTG
jgi:FAD/FMN-containing dehydrogenase